MTTKTETGYTIQNERGEMAATKGGFTPYFGFAMQFANKAEAESKCPTNCKVVKWVKKGGVVREC